MLFEGQSLLCRQVPSSQFVFYELSFNLKSESVNKLNKISLQELKIVIQKLKSQTNIQGLVLTSEKENFMMGADINEFLGHFHRPDHELIHWLNETQILFSDIEDLPFPTVCAIQGFCLGGGFELALATHYRVATVDAQVGLPETKLGIFPGWGGTVRLPRLIGAENAIEWIAGGETWSAHEALKVGALESVVQKDQLHKASVRLLSQALLHGSWQKRRDEKIKPLKLSEREALFVFENAKGFVFQKAGPHYPAPLKAVEVMQKNGFLQRTEALAVEASGFVKVAKTSVAQALVKVFLADQKIKKENKKIAQKSNSIKKTAVLGAGIMGGGIAYQSSLKNIPIIMKDISQQSLQAGLQVAGDLLEKQVIRKKITLSEMSKTLSQIQATCSYGDFQGVDLVVEAVVEKQSVKQAVLEEVEAIVFPETILSSNTSTLSIGQLASRLKRPEFFCGMHFFNPVHRMPLVEVIRGPKTSDQAVATAVSYALRMGKFPIVVNDCPGFLVNRMLFAYFSGFMKLVEQGVDYQRIDRIMERWGWPMGPAYLLDVVGLDTAYHASTVMAEAYSDRMSAPSGTALEIFYQSKRFGQKNGKGFYVYSADKKGASKKQPDPEVDQLLASLLPQKRYPFTEFQCSDEQVIERMMLPLFWESARCLEEKIVASAGEVDLGALYGLGFPPFRGGPLQEADRTGLSLLCQKAKAYSHLGHLYQPTSQVLALAESGRSFYEGELI